MIEELEKAGYKGNHDLDSLIEACGLHFCSLKKPRKSEGFANEYVAYRWRLPLEKNNHLTNTATGSTRIEAISKLLLDILYI